MIDQESIDVVVEQYQRFGWKLRQILFADPPQESITSVFVDRFGTFEVRSSGIDALWFSRKTRDSETWELRRLYGSPFALISVIDPRLPDPDRDELLRAVELKMAETREKPVGEITHEK